MSSHKPAFALFLWSENLGRWVPVVRSDSARKIELMRDLFAYVGGLEFCISETFSASADDVEAASRVLPPPIGAAFVEPAPDGVIVDPSPFDELLAGVAALAQYTVWRENLFPDGLLPAEFLARLLFLEYSKATDRLLASVPGLDGEAANDRSGPSAVH